MNRSNDQRYCCWLFASRETVFRPIYLQWLRLNQFLIHWMTGAAASAVACVGSFSAGERNESRMEKKRHAVLFPWYFGNKGLLVLLQQEFTFAR